MEYVKNTILNYNTEAEQAVIGAIMIDPKPNFGVLDKLETDMFYHEQHQEIFNALNYLKTTNADIHIFNVSERLEKIGSSVEMSYLSEVCDNSPSYSASMVYGYFNILADRQIRRKILAASQSLIELSNSVIDIDEVLSGSQKALSGIEGHNESETVAIKSVLEQALSDMDARRENGDKLIGATTGLQALDDVTRGIRPGLTVIAARPGMGKTILAGQMMLAAAKEGMSNLIFSMEMPNVQLAERYLSASSSVLYDRVITTAKLDDGDYVKLANGCNRLIETHMEFVDKTDMPINKMASTIRTWHRKQVKKGVEPGYILIDYLQLMRLSGMGNKTDQIGEITRALKALSLELELRILLVSQLNRELEKRPNKRPISADLRDSGNIEQDADNIIFIYRDDQYNEDTTNPNIAELILGKARGFEKKTVFVSTEFQYQRFGDLGENYQPAGEVKRFNKGL